MRFRQLVGVAGVAVLAAAMVAGSAVPAHAQGTAGMIEVHSGSGMIRITGSSDHSVVVVRGTLISSSLPIKLTNPGAGECTYYGLVGAFGYVADCSRAAGFLWLKAEMGGGTDWVDVQQSARVVEVYGQTGDDFLKAESHSYIKLVGNSGNDVLQLVGGSVFGLGHTASGANGRDTFLVDNGYQDTVFCGTGDGVTDTVHRDGIDVTDTCNANDVQHVDTM